MRSPKLTMDDYVRAAQAAMAADAWALAHELLTEGLELQIPGYTKLMETLHKVEDVMAQVAAVSTQWDREDAFGACGPGHVVWCF